MSGLTAQPSEHAHDLVATYAVPGSPFANRVKTIRLALTRAIETRARAVPLPGQWLGVMLPRADGKMNFDPSGQGPQSAAKDQRRDWVCGGMGG
jgi:hypothetical protein